ncbi:MAG TPA: DPP IV N-terminal domain-containing protein [Longimicrobiales bacterium]
MESTVSGVAMPTGPMCGSGPVHRVRRRRSTAQRLAAVSCAALVAACGGEDGTGPDPDPPVVPLMIEVAGRVERGAVVGVRAFRDGATDPAAGVEWSAEPAGAVEWVAADSARLLRAGAVTILAETTDARGERVVDVAVPPTVVFDRLVDGNRDIYRVALDGGDLVRLTSHPSDDRDPTVAGGTVVFVGYRDGNGELYRLPLAEAGAAPQRLTATPSAESAPSLSPDGARLAYASDGTGVSKLWTAAADGGGAARATEGFGHGGSIEGSPAWSPGSDRVVFMATSEGTADLYTLDAATGAIAPLVVADGADVEPAWSPDGGRVVFVSNRDGPTSLYLLEVATGAVVRLTHGPGPDGQPAWLPDGRIVYISWEPGTPELRWLDPAAPAAVHTIPIGAGEPGHPAGAG